MKPARGLKAITFPVAAPIGTTVRTTDGIGWSAYGCLRPGVWAGSPDGEHSVGCRELTPASRVAAEDLIPDEPLTPAFWKKVRLWWTEVDAKLSEKKKPRV
jgi:hypothetical protein